MEDRESKSHCFVIWEKVWSAVTRSEILIQRFGICTMLVSFQIPSVCMEDIQNHSTPLCSLRCTYALRFQVLSRVMLSATLKWIVFWELTTCTKIPTNFDLGETASSGTNLVSPRLILQQWKYGCMCKIVSAGQCAQDERRRYGCLSVVVDGFYFVKMPRDHSVAFFKLCIVLFFLEHAKRRLVILFV